MAEDDDLREPYRATRLWNDVILAFRTGMPLKRHRHHIRHYDNCFTSSDCISWLNCYLKVNPNFGPHVTRQQTVQLLQKFLKCRVIESVTTRSGKCELRDNSHLYRFVQYSPSIPAKKSPLKSLLRTPLRSCTNDPELTIRDERKLMSRNDPKLHLMECNNYTSTMMNSPKLQFRECHVLEKQLSVLQVEEIWRSTVMDRLKVLMVPLQIEDFEGLTTASGRIIMHNMTRISRTGVVILLDKSDDIPHWVISAMKCLANWPDASGTSSCLPKYPGFEKDVFKVVRDYFLNPGVPLISSELQSLVIRMFCKFMHENCGGCFKKTEQEAFESSVQKAPNSDVKTSTPIEQPKHLSAVADPSDMESSCIQSAEGKLILDDSAAIWENPLSLCFETEFTATPITRLIPKYPKPPSTRGSSLSLATLDSHNTTTADTLSTMSACSTRKFLTSAGQYNVSSHSARCMSSLLDKRHKVTFYHSCDHLDSLNRSNKMDCTISDRASDLSFHSVANGSGNGNDSCSMYSAIATLPRKATRCSKDSGTRMISPQGNDISDQSAPSFRSLPFLKPDFPISGNNDYEEFRPYRTTDRSAVVLDSNRESFVAAMQLLMLCLPISNRRQIHLLLRMLNKISRNERLLLDSPEFTKDYLLGTFLPALLKLDDDISIQNASIIFSCMIDECEAIFEALPGIKNEVYSQISQLKRQRIKYFLDDVFAFTYCEMISRQQYEEQKLSLSQRALLDLLEKIVSDGGISEKNKRKKLKQFKTIHPDIYYRKFPSPSDEDNLFPKPRKQLLTRFFSMRM